MSHFDDIEPIFYSGGGGNGCGPVGAVVFLVVAVAAIVWAAWADSESENLCKQHGEKYIDSRTGYTLCERTDGTVVRR